MRGDDGGRGTAHSDQLLRPRLLDGRPAALERMTYVEPIRRRLIDAGLDAGSIYAVLTGQGVDLHSARTQPRSGRAGGSSGAGCPWGAFGPG
ncbi:hypothetical protein [Streptomyces sp. NPDC006477]|uniref:hypothetical protein n=1 Tax=Streptomyces sp. NPDC006477 TaxID=3364747 RepID=UPI0036CC5A32